MLRVGKLTDYATAVMALLAEEPRSVLSAAELAARARLELPTVAKLLKTLAQAGLVASTRGAHGGYRLSRAPQRISVADIVAAMEGPIGMTECAAGGSCDHETHCGVRGNWRRINAAIEKALREVSLADMRRERPAFTPASIPLSVVTAD